MKLIHIGKTARGFRGLLMRNPFSICMFCEIINVSWEQSLESERHIVNNLAASGDPY